MTTTPTINLVNQSSEGIVSDAELEAIAAACHAQIARDVAPAWGLAPLPVRAVPRGQPAPTGDYNILVTDTLDEPDAAGWHTRDRSGIHGQVGARVWLDHGGSVLDGANSVSTTCGHEVAELFCNRTINIWRDTGRGWEMVNEVCDPVEGDSYTLDGAAMSNVVLPAYFDPYTRRGTPVDLLGRLRAPFTMDPGGYYLYRQAGQTQQHFGLQVPHWIRDLKSHEATRIGRIIAASTA